MELKDVKEKNEILNETQYLILQNDYANGWHELHTIEISSSNFIDNLSLQVLDENEELISHFDISERMAKQVISFMQNHYNL